MTSSDQAWALGLLGVAVVAVGGYWAYKTFGGASQQRLPPPPQNVYITNQAAKAPKQSPAEKIASQVSSVGNSLLDLYKGYKNR